MICARRRLASRALLTGHSALSFCCTGSHGALATDPSFGADALVGFVEGVLAIASMTRGTHGASRMADTALGRVLSGAEVGHRSPGRQIRQERPVAEALRSLARTVGRGGSATWRRGGPPAAALTESSTSVSWDHRRVAPSVGQLVAEGRGALRAGDAAGARRGFESALVDPASGDVIEGLARASYLELDFAPAIAGWERAYAAHREGHDRIGVVRVARTLAYMYGSIVGDGAVMGGWLARAQTLLGGDIASGEAGWVSLNIGMWEGDRTRREARFRKALDVGRRVGDDDLEFVALAYLGATLVHDDRTEEGMAFLDEALAAVAGSEVDDFCALQEIFCQLFAACEHAHDVSRADQWIRVGEAIASRRRLPAVSAFCRTHYGGILTNAGRWSEADVALTEAVRLWGLGHRSLRGGALARLADLRVRQGRFEEAEQLLDGLEGDIDAAVPRGAVYLAAR